MEHWTEYTRFLTALMVILDPFAAIPIFLSLTQGYSQSQRARVVLVTIITVALVLISSAISGESLLKTFGTSLASFRVGGGIVLFIMALAMLRAQADKVKTSPTEEAAAENKATIAVVPLAIPLLAGPGSISTVIIEMHRSSATYHGALILDPDRQPGALDGAAQVAADVGGKGLQGRNVKRMQAGRGIFAQFAKAWQKTCKGLAAPGGRDQQGGGCRGAVQHGPLMRMQRPAVRGEPAGQGGGKRGHDGEGRPPPGDCNGHLRPAVFRRGLRQAGLRPNRGA